MELGLVEKSELDKRTNQYELTEDGVAAVMDRLGWTLEKIVTDEDREQQVRDLLE